MTDENVIKFMEEKGWETVDIRDSDTKWFRRDGWYTFGQATIDARIDELNHIFGDDIYYLADVSMDDDGTNIDIFERIADLKKQRKEITEAQQ